MELVLKDVVLSRTAQYLSMFSFQRPPFFVLYAVEDIGHKKMRRDFARVIALQNASYAGQAENRTIFMVSNCR